MNQRTRAAALLLFACVSASSKDARIEEMLEMNHVDGFEHFERHGWLMNVFSVQNYTHKGCLFGGQLKVHLESAYMAKHLSRGWVSSASKPQHPPSTRSPRLEPHAWRPFQEGQRKSYPIVMIRRRSATRGIWPVLTLWPSS